MLSRTGVHSKAGSVMSAPNRSAMFSPRERGSYVDFIASKLRSDTPSGFASEGLDSGKLWHGLFPFQRAITSWALRRGRAAICADTGLGKTFMQLVWAEEVHRHTGGNVLILAPLAVAEQTVREGERVGVNAEYSRFGAREGITITNYEMVSHFDLSDFVGIVLDESSILKSHTSKTRDALIHACADVPYRLSCTATPSPNDFVELGNQCEFLGVLSRVEMLAEYFVHDGGETSKWRLKGHGAYRFWEWLSTWMVVIRSPADLGFDAGDYDLPKLETVEHTVSVDTPLEGELFHRAALSLNEQRAAQRQSITERCEATAALVNAEPGEPWIVWCHLNDESAMLAKMIPGAVEVKGADKPEYKAAMLNAFSLGKVRVLVSKPSIAGFGMNWQHCARVAYVGLSHSFEQFYQSLRRCWRYGQKREVIAHLFTAVTEGQVLESIRRKERQHNELSTGMIEHMAELMKQEVIGKSSRRMNEYSEDAATGKGWELRNGDCCEVAKTIGDETIDYSIFSPPFSSLYTYSASDRDMGNCRDDDQFYEHFRFLVGELWRITKPGRLLSFHCMNLPTSKQNHGYIGIRDFRGEMIKMFVESGWIYHSEVVIWKDPVIAMQRTKALGLLYKQLRKDSCMSRQGLPDYLVTMRKPGDNPDPVTKTHEGFPVARWQNYASPVWMDIDPSNTLNKKGSRENEDERHIAPLQLGVIDRALDLWTNPGDLVFSPFAGIGSEGYCSLKMDRRFVGIELKRSYWEIAKEHLEGAEKTGSDLFGF